MAPLKRKSLSLLFSLQLFSLSICILPRIFFSQCVPSILSESLSHPLEEFQKVELRWEWSWKGTGSGWNKKGLVEKKCIHDYDDYYHDDHHHPRHNLRKSHRARFSIAMAKDGSHRVVIVLCYLYS